MRSWVVDNYRWLLDGGLATLLITAGGALFKLRRREASVVQRQTGGKGSINNQAGGDMDIHGS
jgi:hypothetical protein